MDYQGNSNKNKQENEPKPKKEIVEKVIVGEVVQKPKSIGYKFKETFFGGDARTAARYVSTDVLLPALRNLIVDSITKGVERVVWGESMQTRGRRPTSYGSRIQYDRTPIRTSGRPVEDRYGLPDQRPAAWRSPKREFNDIVLSTREEAALVVERLVDIIDKYDTVSLADLYDLLGLPSSHVDNKWGWSYLNNVQIRQIREGYLIELPSLQEI
jgi:hypothetical protein